MCVCVFTACFCRQLSFTVFPPPTYPPPPTRLSFLFRSCGLCTLSSDFVPHNYETLKWLSSLPTLMQKSLWWRQCSDRYIISLFPPPSISSPPPPFSPSLISLMVSVDVKHHVYLLTYVFVRAGGEKSGGGDCLIVCVVLLHRLSSHSYAHLRPEFIPHRGPSP